MTRRFKRAHRKRLGRGRVHGRGNAKHGRGGGERGGVGLGGGQKQRWTWMIRYMPGHFGVHGFQPPQNNDVATTNLYDIDQLALAGKLKKEGDKLLFEFKGKVLGTGALHFPIAATADSFSKHAIEKIQKAGGSATATKPPKMKKEKPAPGAKPAQAQAPKQSAPKPAQTAKPAAPVQAPKPSQAQKPAAPAHTHAPKPAPAQAPKKE
ncbi:50S ribosomal protein L15 [Candidatus Gugararchaeum adminiculabundum]|nr:50S ribosomal protein L15 [Candidatus Gugararchaeum adminiculabundum]